ncbi:1415_t:CDS:2, partial [Gigaspora margarita]
IGVEIDEYYPDKDEEDNMNDNAELNKASDDDNETMVDEKIYEIDKARTKKNEKIKEGISTKDSVDGTHDEEDNLKLVEMEKAMATEPVEDALGNEALDETDCET